MGKEKESIPVIDLSKFPAEYGKLREACEEWGCFRLVNHRVPLNLMQDMKKVARSLLDLPMETKRRNTDVIAGTGYMAPNHVHYPLYESLGLFDVASSQAVHTFCSILDASHHQREVLDKYGQTVYGLSFELAGKIAESLGLRSNFSKEWPCQFRINKYNFTPETVGSTGIKSHTDSGFLTILQDDENVGGLEVMDKHSGDFLPVDPSPGTFLVNLGDVATVWSNGRFCSVRHRVECKEGAVRLSIATLMLGPTEEAVEAPPELVDDNHPRLYVPIVFEEYRKLMISMKLENGEALDLVRIGL